MPAICQKCQGINENALAFIRGHLLLPNPTYKCSFPGCDYRAALTNSLKTHVDVLHNPGRTRGFKCSMCPSKFYTQRVLEEHISRHVREMIFSCNYCDFKTVSRRSHGRHIRTVHEKSARFECPFPGCSFSALRQDSVQRHHRRTHDPDPQVRRPFPCDFPDCTYRTSCLSHLKRHVQGYHNPSRAKEFACRLCSKTYRDVYCLRNQINVTHTNEIVYSCDKYKIGHNAGVIKKHTLGVHEKAPATFKCELSDYSSAYSKQAIHRHLITAHKETRRFKCDNIGCNFQTNCGQVLKKHVLLHDEDPKRKYPFPCNFPGCDFRRRKKCELRSHEQRHEMRSTPDIKCELCPNRSYPDTASLKYHRWVEHSQNVYKCSKCNYIASSNTTLTNHVRLSHDGFRSGQQMNVMRPTGGLITIKHGRHCCKLCNFEGSKVGLLKHTSCTKTALVRLQKICVRVI